MFMWIFVHLPAPQTACLVFSAFSGMWVSPPDTIPLCQSRFFKHCLKLKCMFVFIKQCGEKSLQQSNTFGYMVAVWSIVVTGLLKNKDCVKFSYQELMPCDDTQDLFFLILANKHQCFGAASLMLVLRVKVQSHQHFKCRHISIKSDYFAMK